MGDYNNKKKSVCTNNPSRFNNSNNYSRFFIKGSKNTNIKESQKNLSPTDNTIFSEKNKFELDLIQTLREYKEKVSIKGEIIFFVKELFNIFQDSLNVISGLNEFEQFNNLYYNLPIKDVKYTACSLIFIGLDLIGKKLKVKELAEQLGLQKDNLSRTKNYYIRLISELPKYKNLSRPIYKYKLINYENFFNEINYYINEIKKNLNIEEDFIQINEIFINTLDYIQSENITEKIKTFYRDAPETKDPKYYSAAFWYLYLRYQNNNNLEQRDFLNTINNFENYQLVEKVFSPIYMYILNNYYFIDQLTFREKVSDFLDRFVLKANRENFFNSQITNKTKIKSLELYDIAVENGFKVEKDSQCNRYIFPQLISISLFYYSLKQVKEFEDSISRESLKKLIGENWDYSTATTSRSPIYSFIEKYLPKIKNRHYTRNDFKKILEQNSYRDTDFILKVYTYSDTEPLDFVKRLNIYGGCSVGDLVKFIKRKSQFTEPKIFEKFKNYINNHIPDEFKNELINDLDALLQFKRRDFYHQSVKYSFKWNEIHHNNLLLNLKLNNVHLYEYFKALLDDKIVPHSAFNDKNNPRASDFQIVGTNAEPLKSNVINSFVNNLKKLGCLNIYNQEYYLCRIAQNIYKTISLEGFPKPNHEQILITILTEDESSVAIEVPVWKYIQKTKFLVGHIDLIQLKYDVVKVVDYKPEVSFFSSLPQVCIYGLMLRDFLQIPYNKIVCVSFDKNGAWEYNPSILLTKIKPFLDNLNINRKTRKLDTSWFNWFS